MESILVVEDDALLREELCVLLRQNGFETSVPDDFSEIPRIVEEKSPDLVLLDVKHYTPEGYQAVTSRSMDAYEEFLDAVQSMEVPLWLRHVVVPGLTDGEDHLAGLAEYVKGIRNVKRVELLPYHVLGVPKYRAMGIPYPLEGVPPMESGALVKWQERMNCGLKNG